MNCKTNLSLLFIAAVLLALSPSTGALTLRGGATPSPLQRQKQVKVYFYTETNPEYIDIGPVTRMVRAGAPARAALEALLAGPTRAEESRGFSGLIGAGVLRIVKLTISDGTARAEFRSRKDWPGWPGDIAPARFQKAVEMTLRQFPNVRRVVVSVDGETDLSSGV